MPASTLTEVEMHRILFPAEEVPIGIRRSLRDMPLELHSHKFHELAIVDHGTGLHITETEEYRIQAGDVFLIKPGVKHGYGDVEALGVSNILYYPERLQWPAADLREMPGYHAFFDLEPAMRRQHGLKNRLHLGRDDLRQVGIFSVKLEDELRGAKPGHRFLAFSWFMQLIFLIAKCYSSSERRHSIPLFQLDRLLNYIELNCREDFTVARMAAMAGMSERSLNRCFKTTFGCAPGRYLLDKRLSKAADLLNSTDLPISEISQRTGFSDSNYFARQFRQATGHSPRQYRQRLFSQ